MIGLITVLTDQSHTRDHCYNMWKSSFCLFNRSQVKTSQKIFIQTGVCFVQEVNSQQKDQCVFSHGLYERTTDLT